MFQLQPIQKERFRFRKYSHSSKWQRHNAALSHQQIKPLNHQRYWKVKQQSGSTERWYFHSFVLFKALNLWLAISYSKTKSPTAAWVTQSDRVQPGINSACRQVQGENIFWNMLNFLILVCLRRLGSCQSNQPLSPGYFNTASSGEEKPQFLCTATRGWLQKRVSPHRHPTFGLCGLQWVLLQFQLQLTECKISIYWVLFSYPSQILSV